MTILILLIRKAVLGTYVLQIVNINYLYILHKTSYKNMICGTIFSNSVAKQSANDGSENCTMGIGRSVE